MKHRIVTGSGHCKGVIPERSFIPSTNGRPTMKRLIARAMLAFLVLFVLVIPGLIMMVIR